ncbi:hypothetical protein HNP52_003537 [Sphingomonas kyeonggiensis]|uniref:Killing trait domain-containing protein n=1 Tax=Sphingomonas kyeonggiensis TaxID=1268553 RepID=A0A7W7K4Z0_9SPHN|nr:hypothetical protein [Sphingomonas kyeonggiensis]MBB4840445.1 hypothetical protein [Sphingomonas kyeonggiensis]
MADETETAPQAPGVDPAILDAISQTQLATLGQQVLLSGGAGRAYQSVAASAAIAVQDATDMLRNISTVSTTAIGVAMAQMLEGDAGARETLAAAQATLDTAVRSYATICEAAATALKGFPSA